MFRRLPSIIHFLFARPDSFANEPYGYLTNVLGHGWLGFSLNTFLVWAIYRATGTYPDQFAVFIWVSALYFVVWECGAQSWRGWDSIEDAVFVAYGGSVWAYVDMFYVIDRVFAYTLGALVLTSFGVVKRLKGGGYVGK